MDVPERASSSVRRHPRAPRAQLCDRSRAHRRTPGWPGARSPHMPGRAHRPPGLRAVLPLHDTAAAGRGWTAPDLDRARKLVAQSDEAGARVVVWVPGFRRAVGRNFVALLDDLGFHASLRVLGFDAYFRAISRRDSRKQIGFFGWGLDYVSASSVIEAPFTCPSTERQRLAVLRSPAASPGRPRAGRPWCVRRCGVGRRRPPRRRTGARRSDDEPPLRRVRLQTRRERPAPSAVVHAARPAVGAISRFQLVSRG